MESNKNLLLHKSSLILEKAERLDASQAQVSITSADTSLTRLANSIIDQNVSDRRSVVSISLFFGKRHGSVRFEALDDKSLIEATQMAARIARVSPLSDDIVPLPGPQPYSTKYSDSDLVDISTINTAPEDRANCAMSIISTAHDVDEKIHAVAGAISHTFAERVLVNSNGIEVYEPSTSAEIDLTVLAKDDTEETAGWCRDIRRGFKDLKVTQVSEIAAQKAADGFGMQHLDPGNYEVVLEPAAVESFLFLLAYFAFNARMYQDYASFLRDRIGEQVFSDLFSLWDDALDPRFANPTKYDAEGVPKSRLDLVSDGVVKNIAYDTRTAAIDGTKSTGHSVRAMGRSIPYPTHLIAGNGDSSLDEMLSETRNGILITHFHYENAVDPSQGVFTGLTRDGAWYIKDGEIQSPLKTLRYTDGARRFLGAIDLIGKYPEIQSTEMITPAMKLPSFRITGSSDE